MERRPGGGRVTSAPWEDSQGYSLAPPGAPRPSRFSIFILWGDAGGGESNERGGGGGGGQTKARPEPGWRAQSGPYGNIIKGGARAGFEQRKGGFLSLFFQHLRK